LSFLAGVFRLLALPCSLRHLSGLQFIVGKRLPGFAAPLLPQKVFVIAGIVVEPAALDLKNTRGELVDEVAVVRDEYHRSGKFLQRFEQYVFRLQVEVIGGFIKQEKIRRLQEHARHRVPVALAARKHADALEHVVI